MRLAGAALAVLLAAPRAAAAETTALHADPRVDRFARYLLQSVEKPAPGPDGEYVTQSELSGLARFAHYGHLSYLDLLAAKEALLSWPGYPELGGDRQREVESIFRDFLYLRARLDEIVTYGYDGGQLGLIGGRVHCRYSLADDPWSEIPEDSVYKKPELARAFGAPDHVVRSLEAGKGRRMIMGLCWRSKEDDPVYRAGWLDVPPPSR